MLLDLNKKLYIEKYRKFNTLIRKIFVLHKQQIYNCHYENTEHV